MHTHKHTHISYPQTGLSVCSVRSGRWSEGVMKMDLFCGVCFPSACLFLLSDSLHFTEWLYNTLRTCLDLCFTLVTGGQTDSESEMFQLTKNLNHTLYLTCLVAALHYYGLLSTFWGVLLASPPCMIVKHWYKTLPVLFGSEGLKTNKTRCFTIDLISFFLLN